MRAVLDDVPRWHRGGGEAVHEDGFELPLDEVQEEEEEEGCLRCAVR